jgi:hypothetical protein
MGLNLIFIGVLATIFALFIRHLSSSMRLMFLGVIGMISALVMHALPSSMRFNFLLLSGELVILVMFLADLFNRRWFIVAMRGIAVVFSLLLMFGGLPIAIAQYPTLRQFRCDRTAVRSRLANCYVELKTLGGFGNYRKNYTQVKQAKILIVNAKSSSKPGGKLRSDPINVELSPVFLAVQAGVSQKVETVKPYEPTATSVVTQINQFLQGDQATLSIDIMDVSWDSNSDGFSGGSRYQSQREHIIVSIFMIPMAFCLGALFLLKIFAVETESDDD